MHVFVRKANAESLGSHLILLQGVINIPVTEQSKDGITSLHDHCCPVDWISYPRAAQLQTNVAGPRNITQLSSACEKGRTWVPVFESVQTKIVSPCSRHPSKYRRGFTDKLNFLSLLLTFTELHNWFPELKRTQICSLLCTSCLYFYGLHFYFIIFNFLLPTLEWVLESQYKTYSGLLF